jgi:hypothetical protein
MFKRRKSEYPYSVAAVEAQIDYLKEQISKHQPANTGNSQTYTRHAHSTGSGTTPWITTTVGSNSHWYSKTPSGGASGGTWVQDELPFDDPDPFGEEIPALKQQVAELTDMLAAAWEAITDLQNAVDELTAEDD